MIASGLGGWSGWCEKPTNRTTAQLAASQNATGTDMS
jgi:hypothetical protein